MSDLIWGFSAWVTFLVVNRVASVYWAAAAGVVVALVVLGRALVRHRVHLFEIAGVVFFAGLCALLVAIRPGDLDTWARYAQAVAHGSLTLIVFGSILIGKPFTEPYAREQAPEAVWHDPKFHALNRQISVMWGLAFLIGTISLILAGASGSRQILLRLVVPFGALAWAYTYTQRKADAAGRSEAPDAART
jgi:all-trans-retinol 13,14-reductase